MSAFMAQAGRLVVPLDAGTDLEDSIYEARALRAGKGCLPRSSDCIEKEMSRRAPREELAGAARIAPGFKANPADFRRYGSARKLYNFNIDHAGSY